MRLTRILLPPIWRLRPLHGATVLALALCWALPTALAQDGSAPASRRGRKWSCSSDPLPYRPRSLHNPPMTAPALKLRSLTCARCGAGFDCGSAAGSCWCFEEEYRLPMPPADSASDCLCAACLRSHGLSLGHAKEGS